MEFLVAGLGDTEMEWRQGGGGWSKRFEELKSVIVYKMLLGVYCLCRAQKERGM